MSLTAVLIGLPGVGKSRVGAVLAHQLGVPFADSDELVQLRAGRSVSEIFAADGQAAFRELETAVVLQALAGSAGVLSLGGGAITSPQVRAGLADCPRVVLLQVDAETLLVRVSGADRPLLRADPAAGLATLTRQRAGLYAEVASFTVDSTSLTISQSAARIADWLASHD